MNDVAPTTITTPDQAPDPWAPFERALERSGHTMASLARAISKPNEPITRQALIEWRKKTRSSGKLHVPAERVLAVERALKGELRKERMRPDLYKRQR